MGEQQRQYPRIKVSFPCEILWKESGLRGRIADIARTGALVVELKSTPVVGEEVVLNFQISSEDPEVNGNVNSRVLRTSRDFLVEQGIGYCALEFDLIDEKLWKKIVQASTVET